MPHEELIMAPVTLHPEKKESTLALPLESPAVSTPVCTMKSVSLAISFFNGVDEHIIQTVIRDLKNGCGKITQTSKTFTSFAVRRI